MRINQILPQNIKILSKNSKTPQLDAEVLLCFILNKTKEFLYTYPEYKLTEKETKDYLKTTKERLKNIPIAYIIGFKEFYRRKFITTPDVLVPRPETEIIVDIIARDTQHKTQNSIFIDVGTGSGCIVVSLAKELKTNSKFIAIDISKKALKIAKKNAQKHRVDNIIKFYHGSLLEPVLKYSFLNHKSDIIITANLPYLTLKQIKNAPSIHQEPESALVAGRDGLKYYQELFGQIKKILQIISHKMQILCEIDASQKNSIISLIKKELPSAFVQIKKDLAGLDRLVVVTIL